MTAGMRRILVSATAGIMLGLAFFNGRLLAACVLYTVIWFALSLAAWIITIRRPRPWWRAEYDDAVGKGWIR